MGAIIVTALYLISQIAPVEETSRFMNFNLVNNDTLTVLPIATVSPVPSILSCAARCLDWLPPCYSFIYNQTSHSCTLGTWLLLLATPQDRKDAVVYTSTDVTFKMMSNGTTVTYVWLSSYQLNFTSARDECRAKGAHLYTPKTLEKLNIFLSIFSPLKKMIWVGLNDIEKAFDFVWDDDGSLYSGQPVLFTQGDPNNLNDVERCVSSYPLFTLLADVPCDYAALFLCELNVTLDL